MFSPEEFFDLEDFAHKQLFQEITHVWEAVAKIGEYLEEIPLGKVEVEIVNGVILSNPHLISIGKGSVVEPGSFIKGPCVIGENCQVRQGAYIRGNLITGDFCVIGHDTEVKNSIFLNRSHAAHFNYVGDSILGNHTNLGAGTKCANLKFDGSSVVVYREGTFHDTGMKKLGVVLGDESQTGCNAVTNPGTVLGRKVCVYPCTNVGGYVEGRQIVKPQEKPQKLVLH